MPKYRFHAFFSLIFWHFLRFRGSREMNKWVLFAILMQFPNSFFFFIRANLFVKFLFFCLNSLFLKEREVGFIIDRRLVIA